MKRKREGKETETAASTSSSRDDRLGRGPEVFLSFRGPDTRLTIADTLYNNLIRAGIRAFKDDEELRFGEQIKGGLFQAINDSKIYIPIFSKNYASSKWCLRELALMVKLSQDDDEKVILPIFYDVEVDDVKLETELYRKALQKHDSESEEDLPTWEEALKEVARITGKKLKDYGLDKLNSLTVKEVSSRLWTRRTDVPDHLVGIQDPKDAIMKMLDLGSFDVRYIVIHGMGGIGKTTIADAIFRQISPQFPDCCYFLKDVRTRDILDLQKELLVDILNPRCRDFSNIEMDDMIKTRFRDMKTLIVLDDIDKRDQVTRLAGRFNWFCGGSRIIITTRNIEPFVTESEDDCVPASNRGQFSFYDMPEMNTHDALQLFCERALGCAEPPSGYMDISNEFISVLGGLPLALDVVGSTLRGKSRSSWKNALCKLRKVMNADVKEKLMISYEALEPRQQKIFLDIACFFIHQEKTNAIKYWDAIYEYPMEIEVKILARMSLIKIIDGDELWMHDQLRDLGREIVDMESGEIHLRGSRLWSPRDAFCVVQTKMGTKNIVGLNLGTPEPDVTYRFKRKEFSKLVNLMFLQLDHGNFKGDFKNFFSKLRWLSWSNCPSEFGATNFGLKKLAVLELCRSDITEDWGGWSQIMVAKQLKVLMLVDCPALRKTPKFSSILGLERLILRECTGLEKIDKSIGNLQHLDHLVIQDVDIESLPESIGGLKSLTELRVTSWRLSMLPNSIGDLRKLKHLILECENLQELPGSIGQLESLLELHIRHLSIQKLPYSIGNLDRLKILTINSIQLESLPDSIGWLKSLIELDVNLTRVEILPDCFSDLKKLKILKLSYGTSQLPKSIGMLENLEVFKAIGLKGEIPSEFWALCSLKIVQLDYGHFRRLPTTINQLTNLQELDLGDCRSIQQLPELPESLTKLSFSWDSLITIPDLSNLSNLVDLFTYGAPSVLEEARIEGLERLRALRNLALDGGEKVVLPTDLSSLSQLQSLVVSYAGSRSLISLPSSIQKLTLRDVRSPINWSLFSNLENLSDLCIKRYSLEEILFQVPGKLRKFNELFVDDCPLLKTLAILPGLEEIRRFTLSQLPQLTEIQGLGGLKSLQGLYILHCNCIKSLNESDLSNLKNLQGLSFYHCKSLERVPSVPKSCYLSVEGCPRFNRDKEFIILSGKDSR